LLTTFEPSILGSIVPQQRKHDEQERRMTG
jgi:hypothetical protein